jgi:hypothetical protein
MTSSKTGFAQRVVASKDDASCCVQTDRAFDTLLLCYWTTAHVAVGADVTILAVPPPIRQNRTAIFVVYAFYAKIIVELKIVSPMGVFVC